MQPKFWTDKGLSEEEAVYKIRSFRKMNKEYWIEKGFSEEEAFKKIAEFQSNQSNKYKEKRKENPDKYKASFNTNVEFYLKKGFSEEEAFLKLSERQSTFSLQSCIEKYGECEGKYIFNKRQLDWQKSLYHRKTEDEINDLHKKRDCVSVDYFIRKGYSLNEAELLNREAVLKRMVNFSKASKESLKFFLPLYKQLLYKGYSDDDIFFGYKDKKEWYIWSNSENKIFFYDFCIRSKKMIIEFQGSKFHYNKDIHDENWLSLYSNQTADESMKYDEGKRKLAENNGFSVLYIWDTEDVNEVLNRLNNYI